jgi:gp16 family phage-associated protein
MPLARTREEARAWFEATGITVRDWSADHGFPASVVYALLNGRTRGRRGIAHSAAVALGLKANPAALLVESIQSRASTGANHPEEAVP